MSVLGRLREQRALTEKEWLIKALGAGSTATGKSVTATDAMRIAAVYSCVRVIAETVGSVPFHTYKRIGNGRDKELDRSYHLYPIFHSSPNPEQTAIEFREMLTGHCVLRGNGYAEIVKDATGRVRELWPLLPGSMEVFRDPETRKIRYLYTLPSGEKRALLWEDVFHLRNFGGDGLVGYSTISLFREALALALSTEEFGARFFNNSSQPRGVLESPKSMTKTAAKRLADAWNEAHKGLENSHRVAVLEGGVTWKQTAMNNDDAQWILSRKFQISEIARIYRVPLHMIGELDKATFSNIEHQSIEFVTHTVRPWATRWEQRADLDIYARQPGARSHFSEHDLEGLLRGATRDRYGAYHIALQDGWLAVNEVRQRENLNSVDGGDKPRVPMNQTPIAEQKPPEEPATEPEIQEAERMFPHLMRFPAAERQELALSNGGRHG